MAWLGLWSAAVSGTAVLHPCLHCWGGSHHDHALLGSAWGHAFFMQASSHLSSARWL